MHTHEFILFVVSMYIWGSFFRTYYITEEGIKICALFVFEISFIPYESIRKVEIVGFWDAMEHVRRLNRAQSYINKPVMIKYVVIYADGLKWNVNILSPWKVKYFADKVNEKIAIHTEKTTKI